MESTYSKQEKIVLVEELDEKLSPSDHDHRCSQSKVTYCLR